MKAFSNILFVLCMLIACSSFAQDNNQYEVNHGQRSVAGKRNYSFALSPLNIIWCKDLIMPSEKMPAIGIGIERFFIDKKVSAKIPVNLLLSGRGFYMMPSIQYHPARLRKIQYAIGVQCLILDCKYALSDMFFGHTYLTYRRQVGLGLLQSIRVNCAKNIFIGLDAGFGLRYYDSFYAQNPGNIAVNYRQYYIAGLNIGYEF